MPPLQGILKSGGGSSGGNPDVLDYTIDLITTQDLDHLIEIQNPGNWAFDVVEGFGRVTAAASTTIYGLPAHNPTNSGNMTVRAVIEFPTADARTGVIARMTNAGVANNSEDFYYANVNTAFTNEAVIQKRVAGGALVTIGTGQNFPITLGDVVEITLTVDGDQISAVFENITQATTVNIGPVTDTDIPSGNGGLAGISSGPTTLAACWFREVQVTGF